MLPADAYRPGDTHLPERHDPVTVFRFCPSHTLCSQVIHSCVYRAGRLCKNNGERNAEKRREKARRCLSPALFIVLRYNAQVKTSASTNQLGKCCQSKNSLYHIAGTFLKFPRCHELRIPLYSLNHHTLLLLYRRSPV